MDVTMIGLQNAGKTSLLRVLSVGGRITSQLRLDGVHTPSTPQKGLLTVLFFNRAESSRSSKKSLAHSPWGESPLRLLRPLHRFDASHLQGAQWAVVVLVASTA